MSIYSEVMACEELLNQEYDALTGEITEENEENMDIINTWKNDIIEQGLENLCKVRANKLARIEALKAEKKRIADKQAQEEKRLERLDDYIGMIYYEAGADKVEAGSFTVSTRKSEQVVLTEGFENKDYGKYEFKADKVAIKEALKNGIEIEGATLQTNYNLQVR